MTRNFLSIALWIPLKAINIFSTSAAEIPNNNANYIVDIIMQIYLLWCFAQLLLQTWKSKIKKKANFTLCAGKSLVMNSVNSSCSAANATLLVYDTLRFPGIKKNPKMEKIVIRKKIMLNALLKVVKCKGGKSWMAKDVKNKIVIKSEKFAFFFSLSCKSVFNVSRHGYDPLKGKWCSK